MVDDYVNSLFSFSLEIVKLESNGKKSFSIHDYFHSIFSLNECMQSFCHTAVRNETAAQSKLEDFHVKRCADGENVSAGLYFHLCSIYVT